MTTDTRRLRTAMVSDRVLVAAAQVLELCGLVADPVEVRVDDVL